MQKGVKRTLGFIAAATLLGGGAFAECPVFDTDLPLGMIMTQETTVADEEDNPMTPGVENFIFRFSEPIRLIDYLNPGTEDPADLNYLFNEFLDALDTTPEDSTSYSTTGAAISINGMGGFATVPTLSDVQTFGASVLTSGIGGDPEALSFRNEALSPTSGGDIWPTAPNPTDLADAGSRVVTIYVAGTQVDCTALTADSMRSMDVITSDTGPDRFSGGVSFTPFAEYCAPSTDFANLPAGTPATWTSGWVANGVSGAAPYTRVPAASPAIAGVTELAISSTVAGIGGAASWGDVIPTYQADLLYRISTTMASTSVIAAEAGSPSGFKNPSMAMRFRTGSSFIQNEGQTQTYFPEDSAAMLNSTSGDVILETWHMTRAAGTGAAGTESTLFMEVFDSTDTRGHEYRLKCVTIDSVARASLTGGTVVYNVGGTITNEDGVPAPASPTAFDAGWRIRIRPGNDPALVGTGTNNGTNLTLTFASSNAAAQNAVGEGVFLTGASLQNDRLYIWDYYTLASAGGTSLPLLRMRLNPDTAIPFNQGWNPFSMWDLRDPAPGPTANGAGLAIGSGGVFTLAARPTSLNTTLNSNTTYFMFWEPLFFSGGNWPTAHNGTLVVERAVLTYYDGI